jgi:predicted membrane protein
MLSAIIMGIFVIIMNLIREKNMKDRKQEDFESGPPVAECSTYDMKQADFVGTPFYPMSDRNNFVGEAPYYKPSLDYENIDLNNITNNVIAVSKSVESSKSFNSKF